MSLVVDLVKNSNKNKEKIKEAYLISVNHTQRSLKAHFPELILELLKIDVRLDKALFIWLFPERSKITKCECGNDLIFRGKIRGFGKYCSTKCAAIDPSLKQKRITSNLEKYGVEHISQVSEIKERREKTNLERYGNICSAQGLDQANIRIPKLKLKAEETVKKAKATVKARYGVECATLLPHVRIAMKKGSEQKYENVLLPNILNQLELGGITLVERYPEWKWKHSCGFEFAAPLNKANICKACHSSARSQPEREMLDFIRSLSIEAISGDRIQIAPFELDIFIPSKNMAFELNGVYWHRDNGDKTVSLIKKTELANQKGIKLLHFWDYEWIHKKELVKSMIKNALNLTETKLNARSLTVDLKVNTLDAINFCNENHISGFAKAKMKIGLRRNGNLVCLLLAGKPRFDKKANIEIIRFCTVKNTIVRGGFSKLLQFLEGTIVTYADRRFYSGGAYTNNDFVFDKNTKPNYSYARGELIIPRYAAQKHKLDKLLINFDPLKTEVENMINHNFIKHSDCGSSLFYKYS